MLGINHVLEMWPYTRRRDNRLMRPISLISRFTPVTGSIKSAFVQHAANSAAVQPQRSTSDAWTPCAADGLEAHLSLAMPPAYTVTSRRLNKPIITRTPAAVAYWLTDCRHRINRRCSQR